MPFASLITGVTAGLAQSRVAALPARIGALAGLTGLTVPSPPATPLAGGVLGIAGTPFTNFYYRLWVTPRKYTIQSVQFDVGYKVGIWNAFGTARQLLAIEGAGDGITFNATLPLAFTANQYRVIEFTVDGDVPLNVNVDPLFVFNDTTGTFNIQFSLTSLFRIIPDDGLQESWIWNTAIQVSANGKETRARMRSHPRIQQSISMTIVDDAERANQFSNLWRYLANPVTFPLLQYAAPLQTSALVGATALAFDPMLTRLKAGDQAVLYEVQSDHMELVVILEINGTGAVLKEALGINAGLGWVICPGLKMRLAEDSGLTMNHMHGRINLTTESMEIKPIQTVEYELPVFDGMLVIPFAPVANDSMSEKFNQQLDVLDNNIRSPDVYTDQPRPKVTSNRQFYIERDDPDFHFWPAFANRVKGSLKSFLAPSGRHDFVLSEPVGEDAVFLRVHDQGFSEQFGEGYSRIQIVGDGGVVNRKIIGVAKGAIGALDLVLNTPLTGIGEVTRVSLLHKVRLEDDTIALQHSRNWTIVDIEVKSVLE